MPENEPKSEFNMARIPQALEIMNKPGVWERIHKKMANDSSMAYMVLSVEGNYVWVNRAFSNLVKYTLAELLRMTWHDITPPAGRDFEEAEREKLLRGEKDFVVIPHKLYERKTGEKVAVSLVIYGIPDDDGNFACFFGMATESPVRRSGDNPDSDYSKVRSRRQKVADAIFTIWDEIPAITKWVGGIIGTIGTVLGGVFVSSGWTVQEKTTETNEKTAAIEQQLKESKAAQDKIKGDLDAYKDEVRKKNEETDRQRDMIDKKLDLLLKQRLKQP
jgi:PAS domain S-box-containing protein